MGGIRDQLGLGALGALQSGEHGVEGGPQPPQVIRSRRGDATAQVPRLANVLGGAAQGVYGSGGRPRHEQPQQARQRHARQADRRQDHGQVVQGPIHVSQGLLRDHGMAPAGWSDVDAHVHTRDRRVTEVGAARPARDGEVAPAHSERRVVFGRAPQHAGGAEDGRVALVAKARPRNLGGLSGRDSVRASRGRAAHPRRHTASEALELAIQTTAHAALDGHVAGRRAQQDSQRDGRRRQEHHPPAQAQYCSRRM